MRSLVFWVFVHLAGQVVAAPGGNPYALICDRNIFRLRSGTTNSAVGSTGGMAPNLVLKGVSAIGGRKTAWLAILSREPQVSAKYFSIGEGEQNDFVRVKRVGLDGTVDLVYRAMEFTLRLDGRADVPGVIGDSSHLPILLGAESGD